MGDLAARRDLVGQVGSNLRRFREAAGISQGDLALRADINRPQVNKFEQGDRLPRVDTLVKLAGSLGVTPNDLLAGIGWEPIERQGGGFSLEPGEGDRDAR